MDREIDDLGEVVTYAGKRPGEIRRLRAGECAAHICHGPGHQSVTYCENPNKNHKMHWAYYGSYTEYAEWESHKICSGYFDEPPQGEE